MMPGPLAVATYVSIKVAGYAGFGMSIAGDIQLSDAQAYAGVFPFRTVARGVALALFYGFRDRKAVVILALIAGVLRSYLLDGAMALFYHLPGMSMAIC